MFSKTVSPRLRPAIVIAGCLFAAAGKLTAATISGTVTDADLRTPLASMIVTAYTPAGILQSTGTTDFAGHYVLGLPSGSYRVLAFDQSGAYATTFGNDADSFETSPVIAVTDTLDGVNFGLRRSGSVTGMVFAVSTGRPLAGMTVAAYNTGSGTRRGFAQTDSRGVYSLALPPGQFKLAAYDDLGAFAPRFFLEQATFASATVVNVTGGRTVMAVDLRLDFAGHLLGSVIDGDSRVVLQGMTVGAYTADGTTVTATAVTDPAGNFALSLPSGDYRLVATDSQGIYAAGYVNDVNSFNAQQVLSLTSAQVRNNILIPLHRAATVTGRIQDLSGAPLLGITIAAYNGDGSPRTSLQSDGSGAYSLLLPAGSYRLGAYDNSLTYATQFYPGRRLFRAANPVVVSVGQIIPAVDFSLVRGARFNGRVTDATTGLSVPSVSIGAYDPDGNQMTVAASDLVGNYLLVLPPGAYKFAAFDPMLRYVTAYGGGAPNYENSTTYQADGNSVQRVDFALVHGVRISGTVVDSTHRAVSGVQIAALDLDGNHVAATTCNEGIFDLVLIPNTYKLLASDAWQRFRSSFFNDRSTLASATPVVVQSSGVSMPLTFVLVHSDRRHAVPH